jgi:hypothetical protein
MDLVLYTGVHKPRGQGTKNMTEVRSDRDAFLPKIDISFHTVLGNGESFPIYAREAAPLIAGINMLDALNDGGGRSMPEKALALLRMWMNGRNDLPEIPYTEFDPKQTTYKNMLDIATKYGPPMVKYDLHDIMKRQRNMMWLKGSHVIMKRPSRDKRDSFYYDILVVGKDSVRNEVVIGMKKSVGNGVSRIIPLHSNGLYLVTSIMFMTEVRPSKFPVITGVTLDRLVMERAKAMEPVDMVFCDITNNTSVFMERLGIEPPP